MHVTSFKLTRNVTILFLDLALTGSLNYAFWIILARISSLEVSGGVAIIFSINEIFSFLFQPGIPMATSKYVSEHISRQNPISVRKTIKYAIILVLSLSLIAAVLLILLADRIAGIYEVPDITTPLRVSALLISLIPLLGVLSGVYQGFQKMEYCLIQSMLQAGSRFFLGLGLVLLGFGVIGPVFGMIFGGFSSIFFAFFFIPRLLRQIHDLQSQLSVKNPKNDVFKWTDLIRLGMPNSVINGVIKLSGQTGTLILGLFGGSLANVAWYYLSLEIILAITLISRALGVALLPAVSSAWTNKRVTEFKSALNLCLRYFYLIASPIVIIAFFFPEEILIILGKEFLPAASMFRILLLAIPAIGTMQIFVSVLTGIGSIKWLIRLALFLLVLYFVLAIGLTASSGLIGISGAFTISIIIGAIATFWMIQHTTKIPIELLTLAKILVPSIIFVLIAKTMTALSLNFLLSICFGFVVYTILSYIIGTFMHEDIVLIKNFLRLLIRNPNEENK